MCTDTRLLTRAGELRSGRTPFVLATVVRAERPTSARPGDAALVLPDGTVEGFVGGACAESTTRVEGLRYLRSGESGLVRISPDGIVQDEVRTVVNPCRSGGLLEIFFETVLPPALVAVLGDAPVARALVRVGEALDLDVRTITDGTAPLAPDTAAVVVASHGRDEPAVLSAALAAGVPYVALVASPRRAAGVLGELAGVPGVERVHAPAGLDIGARTPQAVALSIYAQLVAESPPPRPPEVVAAPADAVDPVCGMTVAAVPTSLHSGEVYFCGSGCLQAWLDDPGRYPR
ncbi:MAG: XdhC family protein [Pseudonocardia sp.]|nr:XdhC family protein [Pseudonocardia sp.]